MAEKTSENIVIEILKNQQRVAIKAAVIASVAAAKAKREALEGQAANAAKDYLSQMPKPELTSPIKS